MKSALLTNSHEFLKEAVKTAIEAEKDPTRWTFAILHVVQAMELTLKEILSRHHRLLVYENVDAPDRLVSFSKAIERLSKKEIGLMDLSASEVTILGKARELRNKVMHAEFEYKSDFAAAKFSEVFALLAFFQASKLGEEIENVIDRQSIDGIMTHQKSFRALLQAARRRISDENIPENLIFLCTECGQDTFVAKQGVETCYLCRVTNSVAACPLCKFFYYADDLQDISDLFEYSEEGGILRLENDFDFGFRSACPDCKVAIADNIEGQKTQAFFDDIAFTLKTLKQESEE